MSEVPNNERPRRRYTLPIKKWTAEAEKVFLEALAVTGRLKEASVTSGLPYMQVIEHRRRYLDFEEACEDSMRRFRDSLEREAVRRGMEGVEEPVFHKGEECGFVRRYSDRLLELVMKRHIPEYRERLQVDANVRGGVLVVGKPAESEEEWRRIVESPAE